MARPRHSRIAQELLASAEDERRCAVSTSPAEHAALMRAVANGQAFSPLPGIYASRETWTRMKPPAKALFAMRAYQALHPDWTFVGPSAALAYGLSVSYGHLLPLRIAVSRRTHSRSSGAVLRQIVEQDDPIVVNGLRVCSLARCAFDCLREMSFPVGLAVADSLLRVRNITTEQLLERLRRLPHNSCGWANAMQTAAHADPRAMSGGESIARARMLIMGYELPDLQVALPNKVDGGTYYGDFGWHRGGGHWLIGELDGNEKYVDEEMSGGDIHATLRAERLRESRVGALDVNIMRFSYEDMMNDRCFQHILDAYGTPRARWLSVKEEERYCPLGLHELIRSFCE